MKYQLLLILLFVALISATNLRQDVQESLVQNTVPCLPNTNLSGNTKEETQAQRARKHLTRFADDMAEQLRKTEGRQPFPNMYPESDNNCVGPGQDPSKRDRRMRRG